MITKKTPNTQALMFIKAQLEEGYIDLGTHHKDELDAICEAIKCLEATMYNETDNTATTPLGTGQCPTSLDYNWCHYRLPCGYCEKTGQPCYVSGLSKAVQPYYATANNGTPQV